MHVTSSKSFSVAHYSGTVSYQLRDVLAKNRDFLAPEIVETMRMSRNVAIKDLFTNRLTKSGNLTVCRDKTLMVRTKNDKISRWGAALMAEKTPIRVSVPKTRKRGKYFQFFFFWRTRCRIVRNRLLRPREQRSKTLRLGFVQHFFFFFFKHGF